MAGCRSVCSSTVARRLDADSVASRRLFAKPLLFANVQASVPTAKRFKPLAVVGPVINMTGTDLKQEKMIELVSLVRPARPSKKRRRKSAVLSSSAAEDPATKPETIRKIRGNIWQFNAQPKHFVSFVALILINFTPSEGPALLSW